MDNPSVTVLLPVRNEERFIAACIHSILNQASITGGFELIILDGSSDDSTRSIAEQFVRQNSNVFLVDNPAKKVTTAVNLGIAAARGTIVMRMDAHALYAQDYIVSCLRVMEKTDAANVGGHALALPAASTAIAHAIALAHHSPFGLGGASFRNINSEGYVETVWPGCFKKEVFEKAGLLTEALERSEDIELNYRIRKAGYRIYLSPEIKAWYFCRSTLRSLWRQRWLDGKGVMQTLQFNIGAVRPRHFVPLLVTLVCLSVLAWFVVSLTGNRPQMAHFSFVTMLIGAGLYCALSLYFSLSALALVPKINTHVPEISRQQFTIKKSAALFLPIVFAVLHFSYGFGSITGLFPLLKSRKSV